VLGLGSVFHKTCKQFGSSAVTYVKSLRIGDTAPLYQIIADKLFVFKVHVVDRVEFEQQTGEHTSKKRWQG
jgi:hypothetical protein